MPPKSAAKGTGAGPSSSASRARSPGPEQEHVPDDSTLGGHSSSRRGRLTHGDPAAGRRPGRRQSPRSRSRSASTTARGKTAAAARSKNPAQSASRRRASPRLAGPSTMRSSRPSTAERRKDTEARSSVRQGTRRRSSSAKPAVAPKLRGLLATNEDSSSDESRVRAGQSTKRSRPSIAEKQGGELERASRDTPWVLLRQACYLNFQGRSDEVADANDRELVSDVTDADFSDDDSYQPSLLSDDTASDDDDELDWNPVPMTVNICFNGVDGDMKRQRLLTSMNLNPSFVAIIDRDASSYTSDEEALLADDIGLNLTHPMDTDEEEDFQGMTHDELKAKRLPELRAICKRLRISCGKKKKDEIIAAILAGRNDDDDNEPPTEVERVIRSMLVPPLRSKDRSAHKLGSLNEANVRQVMSAVRQELGHDLVDCWDAGLLRCDQDQFLATSLDGFLTLRANDDMLRAMPPGRVPYKDEDGLFDSESGEDISEAGEDTKEEEDSEEEEAIEEEPRQ
ncbi:hypothetical protein THAOC_07709, partial [Thalassiosira oceanica]